MHMHTKEVSICAQVPASEIVTLYKEAGFNGMVITDHFYKAYFDRLGNKSWKEKIREYMSGYNEALVRGQRQGIDVFFGMELRFNESPNDYLIFGIDEDFLIENERLYDYNIEKFKSLVENKDVLIYQAHPFRPGITTAVANLLDGVEVFNGNPRHDSKNHLALEFAKVNNLRTISGSDFHELEDTVRGGLVLKKRPANIKELVNILRKEEGIELITTGV
jgi:predicted metal-dependent phosphoesterase TrpH